MKTFLLLISISLTLVACGNDDDDNNLPVAPYLPTQTANTQTIDATNQKIENLEHIVNKLTAEWKQIQSDLDQGVMPDLDSLKTSVDGLLTDLDKISRQLEKLSVNINAISNTTSPNPTTSSNPIALSNRIAFESDGDIFSINPDGTDRQPLVVLPGIQSFPSWSPDRTHVAFVSEIGVDGWNIFVGKKSVGSGGDVAYSPRGFQIAQISLGSIYVTDIQAGEWFKVVEKGENPAWSSDGSRLAFNARQKVYTVALGGEPKFLTEGIEPAWSPDGSKIAFMSWVRRRQQPHEDYSPDIFVIDIDGSNRKNLTNDLGQDRSPVWSPDGSMIAFSSWRDDNLNYEIYVMNADGTQPRNITNDSSSNDVSPTW